MKPKAKNSHCGYVAIVGRPNVGKSTLLNKILGQKISITSRKPQTTRHQILGVKTVDSLQAIFVDTPGIHKAEQKSQQLIHRYMNRVASSVVSDVDAIVFVVEPYWKHEDQLVLDQIQKTKLPVILVVNKIDALKDKQKLLPFLESCTTKMAFEDIVPVSAKTEDNIKALEAAVMQCLPEGTHFFNEDDITDRNQRFLVSEIIREKLIRSVGNELPYVTAVTIEHFKDEDEIIDISALIYVERVGQKKIIIGEKGQKIKSIGQAARLDIEALLDKKVHLRLWVKIKEGWYDDERVLRQLGYAD